MKRKKVAGRKAAKKELLKKKQLLRRKGSKPNPKPVKRTSLLVTLKSMMMKIQWQGMTIKKESELKLHH